jgi:hypothetical protein
MMRLMLMLSLCLPPLVASRHHRPLPNPDNKLCTVAQALSLLSQENTEVGVE